MCSPSRLCFLLCLTLPASSQASELTTVYAGADAKVSTDTVGPFLDVSAGFDVACGLEEDGDLICWGLDTWKANQPPEGPFRWAKPGYVCHCGIRPDGQGVCWGRSKRCEALEGTWLELYGGNTFSCGLTESHEVLCWGSVNLALSSSESEIAHIAVGNEHVCVLEENGRASCVGHEVPGCFEPPSDARFKQISIDATYSEGDLQACGITTDDTIRCWGYRSFGEPAEPAAQIEKGENPFYLGVTTFENRSAMGTVAHLAGTAALHGGDAVGLGVGVLSALSMSIALAVRHSPAHYEKLKKRILNWGLEHPPEGVFREVAVGATTSYALTPTGDIVCWGPDCEGAPAPEGTFRHLSSSFGYTCGLRDDGRAVCWGVNLFRTVVPP